MSYATESWSKDDGTEYPNMDRTSRRAWVNDLSALIDNVDPTTHQITSILSLLSASVKQGSALPPYIERELIPYKFPIRDEYTSLQTS
jgi:hypothetical protein